MIQKLIDIFFKVEKPVLGRWSLKNCSEMSASINSVYQNRDHCGDTICKTPKRASDYYSPTTLKSHFPQPHLPLGHLHSPPNIPHREQ
jgi:hypothetical protein